MKISEEQEQKEAYYRKRLVKRIAKLSALGILAAAACLQHFALTLPQPKKDCLQQPTALLSLPVDRHGYKKDYFYCIITLHSEC